MVLSLGIDTAMEMIGPALPTRCRATSRNRYSMPHACSSIT
jgi:hypothetical protein